MNAKILLYAILPVILATNMAFAAPASLNQSALNAAMSQISCKTNFTVSFLNDIVAVAPNSASTLTPYITNIQQETQQLQSIASGGSIPQFRSYVIGTYDPELKTIRIHTPAVLLKSVNITSPTRQQLRAEYNTSKATYQVCAFNSLKSFANIKVQAYQQDITAYQQNAQKMASKGVSTTTYNQTISAATPAIIMPLQSAISSASNESQLRQAVNGYCLFNGCPNGINDHIAAKLADNVLASILSKTQSLNATKNQTANFAIVQGYLATASSTLQAAGTAVYQDSQGPTIWGSLHNASAELKMILKSVK